MNVSGYTTLANNTTVLSTLNVSGFTTLNGNVTCLNNLNVLGNINAPNLDSKAGFTFTCASTLVLNSTTYYKWDIDLTKYTTSLQLPQGAGYNLRKFRIYTWLASSDLRQSTGRLDENSYSIWMSNLSGVYSIRAYGICAGFITDNYYLTKIPAVASPQFLLSNSYTNLTYASSILGTYVMCLIIDELS